MSCNVNERTYVMVKPDGVQRGLVGNIIGRFEKRGFKLIALKLVHATPAHIEKHYEVWSGTPFFPGLIKFMTSGPVVAYGLARSRRCQDGPRDARRNQPAGLCSRFPQYEYALHTKITGTIRGDFALDIDRTICHGSDSVEDAEKEIKLWFPEGVVQYDATFTSWILE
ncbi:nucleoside diphosphate kinase [Lactarius sanguifluus]|nr:nucleoside diphosphate kinase [Lactarius sanguifluus]